MSDLYHITGHMNIIVRADSHSNAAEIAQDVVLELPEFRDTDKINIVIMINKLVEPEDGGNGYCYPSEPTVTKTLNLEEHR